MDRSADGLSAVYSFFDPDLAADPDRLRALKEKLARNRLTTPLFDTALYTRRLEAAFEAMHARRLAGLPPDDIFASA